jgi:hypothetical protein
MAHKGAGAKGIARACEKRNPGWSSKYPVLAVCLTQSNDRHGSAVPFLSFADVETRCFVIRK